MYISTSQKIKVPQLLYGPFTHFHDGCSLLDSSACVCTVEYIGLHGYSQMATTLVLHGQYLVIFKYNVTWYYMSVNVKGAHRCGFLFQQESDDSSQQCLLILPSCGITG